MKKVKNQLLIFDMDGTLFDSSKMNYFAYKEAAKHYGYNLDIKILKEILNGGNYKSFLSLVGVNREDVELIHEEKKKLYIKFLCESRCNDCLLDLIREKRDLAYIALATTASRKNTLEILDYYNIGNLFDFIITQEDVLNLKPDPECYFLAMKLAGLSPAETVIYEDSEIGIKGAERSGASCVKICKW